MTEPKTPRTQIEEIFQNWGLDGRYSQRAINDITDLFSALQSELATKDAEFCKLGQSLDEAIDERTKVEDELETALSSLASVKAERDGLKDTVDQVRSYIAPRMAVASTQKLRVMLNLPVEPPVGTEGRIQIIKDQNNE